MPGDGPLIAEHSLELAPSVADATNRLGRLTGYFHDIASGIPFDAETGDYLQSGGSIRLCLSEIGDLSGTNEYDTAISDARSHYMGTLLKRPVVRGRSANSLLSEHYEDVYVDSVLAKVGAIVDAETADDALAVGQLPTLLEQTSFKDGEQVSPEQLAANHLYILVDTALKEHEQRRALIDGYRTRSFSARVVGSRALHLAIAGGVFAATLVPDLGVLPAGADVIGGDMDTGLKILSGMILGFDTPEALRMQYLDAKHDKRTKELRGELAAQKDLSDQALRIAYSSTRYGRSERADTLVTGRSGTDDKEENLRRFDQMDHEFPHLNNDPGGKPYSGNQVLGYSARLLIERKDQLAQIIDPKKTAAAQKQLFLELTREILVEDVTRMKKGLSVSRFRKSLMGAVAIVPAILMPTAVSAVSDASSLGQDTVGTLTSEVQPDTTGERLSSRD
jgi:hypothetical protein